MVSPDSGACAMASEASLPLEHRTQPDAAFLVHVEDKNCGAAHRSQADNHNVGNLEMLFPGVLTWVEELGDVTGFRIDTREIAAFVRVASVAGQRQVGKLIIATVLARNDVLDLECGKREVLLLEQTIFAAIAGSAPD
jgi:hypothetical protein